VAVRTALLPYNIAMRCSDRLVQYLVGIQVFYIPLQKAPSSK
jgi:hypothetical protein